MDALVEARLDLLDRPPDASGLERLVRATRGRLLATCRPGGTGAPPSRDERRALLASALRAGAAAVDVEADSGEARDFPPGEIVLSHHEPVDETTSAERRDELVAALASRAARLATEAGRVVTVKLAVPAASAVDALALARAGAQLPAGVGWAPIGLGPGGRWLRILAGRDRGDGRPWSALGYGSTAEPLPGAPTGQLPLRDMLDVYRAHRLGAATRVFGVTGWPLAATWSPALHSRLFAAAGIDAVLVPLPCRDAVEIAAMAEALDLEGLAITMPHKLAARVLATAESDAVRRAGVVNTLRRSGAGFEAESFDGAAVADLLAERRALDGARVVVVGAGGAARAAGAELARAGARVTFVARDAERAAATARAIAGAFSATLDELATLERDVVINATPALDLALDAPILLDMVTQPPLTPLVARARAAGRVGIDGLAMLARQAAAQQRWWLGDDAASPPALVESTLREIAADG